MMVCEVEETMPVEEFYQWLAYMQWKNEEEKKAYEKAKKKGGRR